MLRFQFEKDGIFEYVELLNEAHGDEVQAPGVVGARFSRLLRFGLATGGTGDIPLTKRAFKDFDKAQHSEELTKGKVDGALTHYRKNGSIKSITYYKQNKINGKAIIYSISGGDSLVHLYKNG